MNLLFANAIEYNGSLSEAGKDAIAGRKYFADMLVDGLRTADAEQQARQNESKRARKLK